MRNPVSAQRPPQTVRRTLGGSTLRAQFTGVIFLLAFLPNIVLTLMAQPTVPLMTVLAWMLVVGMLCGVVGYVLSGSLLRAVSRLQDEVEAGRFRDRHPDDPREILTLRAAFTGLLDRLSTEQGRRNAFIATLVHDLKTPLIATGHLTRALTTLPLPDAERREVGRQIQAETQRLLDLVQQMADAHRFEQEDVQVQCAPTDLRGVLDTVAQRLAVQAEERGLSITVTGAGVAPADAGVLERAVTNLTVNALRYARTQVKLSVDRLGLHVTDDGPGLPAPLNELAQPFNAQPTMIAGRQYTSGTAGLGLFIVRRIAEAHGGRLSYARESHSPTEAPPGLPTSALPPTQTRFTLFLPEVHP
ncbi:HAMP domain-containing histidine kinase [Deinococcus taeanensis]|uniref:sensor histidine kinase n=1 Tax=Deinococcus taeanensis TaxID=2737050 RepID=UPI001CDCAB6F|nr:HAMP domain-containing sensor histidine kinase [Deinococcus taeanensis]UBV41587.1 HAMP domain-containing histidine kinase [Deinococcus taeanensis]